MTKSKGIIKRFTAEEDNYIINNYLSLSGPVLAQNLNRSLGSVYGRMERLNLRIPAEIKKQRQDKTTSNLLIHGASSRFPKGNVPVNKGKKMTAEVYEKAKATMFKKGHQPHNTKAEHSISVRNDKSGVQYIYYRLSKAKWVPLHRVIWEKEFGNIPKGHNVIFKDKNRTNFSFSNLQLVSNKELMLKNSIQNYPEDLRKLIFISAALKRQINKILNHE